MPLAAIPIIDVITSVALIGGGVAIGEALSGASKTSSQGPAQATTPTETSAAATASAAQTQQRQAALSSGGSTNITGGSGIILGSDVSSVTLVGSS